MKAYYFSAALVVGFFLAETSAYGQFPGYPPIVPESSMAPLLHVRLTGPEGTQVTFYRARKGGQTFPAPTTVGLRPGYIYRLAVKGLPGDPNMVLFPTLEVRGSLKVPRAAKAAEFPATLPITDEDLIAVKSGGLVTKVIILESPEKALALASRPDQPLELEVPANRDPVKEAMLRGRPVLIMHLGQRQFSEQELTAQAIPGTLLMPGETVLSAPPLPPWIGHACFPVVDPLLGPPDPSEEVALYDGGDVGLKVGVQVSGRLVGLDPTDTVVQYIDSQGLRRVCPSNRVALCIPRFIVARTETYLEGRSVAMPPGYTRAITGQEILILDTPPVLKTQVEAPGTLIAGQRPSGTVQIEGTAITGKIEGIQITTALHTPAMLEQNLPPPLCPPPGGKLCIIKWPDKCGGQVGDLITFSIRYSNQGGQPVTDVVVTDSLGTRFEYVPGSAQADREVVFTTQPNDGGSATLRWEFPGQLLPRQSGLVTFQVRIR